jgi:hypothetical protein
MCTVVISGTFFCGKSLCTLISPSDLTIFPAISFINIAMVGVLSKTYILVTGQREINKLINHYALHIAANGSASAS